MSRRTALVVIYWGGRYLWMGYEKRLRIGVVVLCTALTVAAAACSGGAAAAPTPLPTIPVALPKPGIEVLADRYYEALNAGNINAVVILLDQDVVLTDGETQVVGKADVIALLITGFSAFAEYAYSGARIEGNSFFADHTYEVSAERDTGIFPLASEPIELVAQNGKITFINVGAAAAPPSAEPAAAATPTAASVGDPETLGALKSLAFEYWIAFNEHDVDKVLSYLEESYRAERAEEVSAEIAQLKLFGVTLGLSERSPPVLLSPTEGEMMLNLREPLGVRKVRMAFRMIDGEWKITFGEEVE